MSINEHSRNAIAQKTCIPVMLGAGILILFFIIFTLFFETTAQSLYSHTKQWITVHFSWYYIIVVNICLFSCIYLLFSKHANLRLGGHNETPSYSYFSWFSMLFGAGMGIGILFYSIAEPIYYFQYNPFISNHAPVDLRLATAFRTTFFHWGLHAWGIFCIAGLMLAFLTYRYQLPLSIRSLLYPIIKDKIYGPIGHMVDCLAIFGTVFGIATSLGLGAQQINAGLSYLANITQSTHHQILIITIISVIAMISVLSGLDKGIKWLSRINMKMTIVLLVIFLIFGPTVYILSSLVTGLGDYLFNSWSLGFWVNTHPSNHWQQNWTLFYWGWWLSWMPFVSIFVARISKGRTLREFILGVLIVPALVSLVWITVFGASAFYFQLSGSGQVIAAINQSVPTALFKVLAMLHIPPIMVQSMALFCVLLLCTYFITSADSATLVTCSLVCAGNPEPSMGHRLFWGSAIGTVSAVLLLSGGLKALQTASIISAFPISFILLFAIFGFLRLLNIKENDPS